MTCHFDRKIVLVFAVWLPWLKPEAVESWLTFTLSYDVAGIQATCYNHNCNCVWAPLQLCGLVIEGNLTLLGPSTFANFRCNLVSEKRLSVSARYAWELPEKLLSVECVKNHSLLRYHSPYASPVYALLSQYDRPTGRALRPTIGCVNSTQTDSTQLKLTRLGSN